MNLKRKQSRFLNYYKRDDVGDGVYDVVVMNLTILVTNIHYLFALASRTNIQKMSPTSMSPDTGGDKDLKFLIKNNGFDPHFETTFKIGQIGIPEVSFLKILVFDEDGPLDKDDFGEFSYWMAIKYHFAFSCHRIPASLFCEKGIPYN